MCLTVLKIKLKNVFVPDCKGKKTKHLVNRLTHNHLVIRSFYQGGTRLYSNGVNAVNEIFKTNFQN